MRVSRVDFPMTQKRVKSILFFFFDKSLTVYSETSPVGMERQDPMRFCTATLRCVPEALLYQQVVV